MGLQSLIDKIFTLPPPERRRMIGEPIRGLMFGNYTPESNDTYIYYLTFKYSLILCLIFSALNWVSYAFGIMFNFLLFEISIPKQKFNEAFLFSYSFYMTGILWTTVLPYCFILFRKNVDWKNFDPTWWRNKNKLAPQHKLKSVHLKILLAFLVLMPAQGVALYWPFKRFYLHESNYYFIFSLLFLPLFLAVFNQWLLISWTSYQHYKTNSDRDITLGQSNSKRERDIP